MTSESGTKTAWARVLGTLGGIALGAVLLVAAWAKALDPMAFIEQIRAEGLDFLLSAQALAFAVLALEVGLGLALVLGIRRLWVLLPAAALVAFFLFLNGRNYWLWAHGQLDAASACGCFGNLALRTPAEAFWQDLFLLLPPLGLAFLGRPAASRPLPRLRLAVVAVAVVGSLVFAWKAPELPLDDLATRLKPGVEVDEVCATGGDGGGRICLTTVVPELEQGRHVVVLADLEDEKFTGAVDRLNAYTLDGHGPTLWVMADASSEEHTAFYWQWGPSFEIREAPAPLLRPLYRRLPRSFVVHDGGVVTTFNGLPPLEEMAATSTAGETG